MIIRQAAFQKGKPFQKGALHCHTTRSDGDGSPEEVMRLHAQNGYTFMALTDHNIFNRKNYAPDQMPTVLSGIERNMELPGPSKDAPICVHVVGLGDPEDPRGPKQDEIIPSFGQFEESAAAQGMIDQMHDWGLKTVYAHPEWSGTKYEDFRHLKGNFAMEIWNTGCAYDNGQDTNAAYLDEAWDDGNYLWGAATDDGHPMWQHCKGWVMVSSDNNPKALLEALEKGEFYASCGPVIEDFYVEDHTAYVKCEPAESIRFVTLRYPLRRVHDTDGHLLREASCKLPEGVRYVRAVVTDAMGRRAWTNPIALR